jgi:hypothetical protein
VIIFGPKFVSMDPARLPRVQCRSHEQVQPSVPAPGAPAAEQGRVGVEGRSKSKIGPSKKSALDILFILAKPKSESQSRFFHVQCVLGAFSAR